MATGGRIFASGNVNFASLTATHRCNGFCEHFGFATARATSMTSDE